MNLSLLRELRFTKYLLHLSWRQFSAERHNVAEGLLRLGVDDSRTMWVVEWGKDQGGGIRRNSWRFQAYYRS